jgi:hypothetical protein
MRVRVHKHVHGHECRLITKRLDRIERLLLAMKHDRDSITRIYAIAARITVKTGQLRHILSEGDPHEC